MSLKKKMLLIVGIPLACLVAVIAYLALRVVTFEGIALQEILRQEQVGVYYLVLTALAAALFFAAVIFFFMDRLLLSRLSYLGESVSRIGTGGDFSARVDIRGSDEIAALAGEINGMLLALEWSHTELRESEARFRRITDNMLDMIAQLDRDGKFLYVSPSHSSVLGYEKEEMLGRPLIDFVHLSDRWKAEKFLHSVVGEFPLGSMELRLQHREGRYVWVQSVGSYMADRDGFVSGIILSSRDITEHKQAEEALKESEEKHRQIITTIEEGYYEADLDGNFTFFNDALCRIAGCSAEELKEAGSTILCTDSREINSAFHKVLLTGNPRSGLTWKLNGGGEEDTFVEVSISLIKDEQGNAVGFRGLVRDVTERKRAEEKIRRMNEELERRVAERTAQLQAANKELEAFSYSVSHDLRSPLRSIDGFSTALLEDFGDGLEPQARDYLLRVRAASQRMGQLIDDMLNLSRVTRSEMSCGKVDLSALAREILEELQQSEPQREVELVLAPGLTASGDARLLRIMMENLLNNAWKFTGKNDKARIEFGLTENGCGPVYYVKDDGAGFEMEYADKLFGPFQRLHSPGDFAGTGVGLATVARIVHRHGGSVWAEGAVGEGATFYFTLPVDGAQESEGKDSEPEESYSARGR